MIDPIKNLSTKRLTSLIKKDLLIAKNKISSLLALYFIYIVIAFLSLRELKSLFITSQGNFLTLFLLLFLFQSGYIIAFMLFPQFVYKESISEKHEIYFAYQFNVLEIVLPKAIMLCCLSLFPSYILLFILFGSLLVFSVSLILCLFFVMPLLSFAFIAFNVLLTWFIKGGRIISTGLLLIFIFLLTKSTRILKPSLNLSYGNISLFLSAISFLLIIGIVLISSLIKKERCIIKN